LFNHEIAFFTGASQAANDTDYTETDDLMSELTESYYSGNYQQTVDIANRLLSRSPNNQAAMEYRQKAEDNLIRGVVPDHRIPFEARVSYNRANSLVRAGNYEEAEPHIGHPVEELYSDIEAELPARNVADFKPTLVEMQDLFKSAPESPETQQAISDSLAAIDGAVAALPAEKSQSPELVMDVIVELLKNATAEYEAAIANNKFVEVEEYQDSRGFVLYAEELYQNISEQKNFCSFVAEKKNHIFSALGFYFTI